MTREVDSVALTNLLRSIPSIPCEQKLSHWLGIIENHGEDSLTSVTSPLADIEAIYAKRVGGFKIPFIISDLNILADKNLHPSDPKSCFIQSSQCNIVFKEDGRTQKELAFYVTEKMLQIKFDNLMVNLELAFKELLICKAGGKHQRSFNAERNSGTFGTLLLQIPIETEQPAGSLLIQDKQTEMKIELATNKHYFAAACTNHREASYSLQADQAGIVAVMVFDLVWTDFTSISKIIHSYGIPEFLKLTYDTITILSPWNISQNTTTASDQSKTITETQAEDPYLCFPITQSKNAKLERGVVNLKGSDLLTFKLFSCIDFIDVNVGQLDETASSFALGVFSQNSLKDDLFDRPVKKRKVIPEDASNTQVLVIRPRHFSMSITQIDSLLSSLEERSIVLSASSFRKNSLLRELDFIAKSIPKIRKCTTSILYRTLSEALRLEAVDRGLALFALLLNSEGVFKEQSLTCLDKSIDSLNILVEFICSVAGWERCLNIIVEAMPKNKNRRCCSFFCALGVQFDRRNFRREAALMFEEVIKFITNLAPLEQSVGSFWTHFINLAMQLDRGQEANDYSKRAVVLMKILSPAKFQAVVVHLNAYAFLNCSYLLKHLGNFMKATNFRSFDALQFLSIISVYEGHEEVKDFVRSFWDIVCTQCIKTGYVKKEKNAVKYESCLFCQLLITGCDDLKKMVCSPLAKCAVICSIEKLADHRGMNLSDIQLADYIKSILLLEQDLKLIQVNGIQKLCSLFPHIGTVQLCQLPWGLLNMTDNAFKSGTTASDVMQCILMEILKREVSILSEVALTTVFHAFAWYGDVDLMKKYLEKMRVDDEHLLQLITEALYLKFFAKNAASSELFKRAMFSLLIKMWIQNLCVEDSITTVNAFIDCFHLFAEAEHNFSDAPYADVVPEFTNAIKVLNFLETVEIAEDIYTHYAGSNVSIQLQALPNSWKVYCVLCNRIVKKLDESLVETTFNGLKIKKVMLCLLWAGREAPIRDFCRLICELTTGFEYFLIYCEDIKKMAATTSHGVLALIDLIDSRILRLNARLKNSVSPDTLGKLNAAKELRRKVLLSLAREPEARRQILCSAE